MCLEVVGRPGGGAGHVLEGEAPLLLVPVQVEHGQLLGVPSGNGVHANSSTPHGMIAVGGSKCVFCAVVISGEKADEMSG